MTHRIDQWPDPEGVSPIAMKDVPLRALILGLAPIGVRWSGRRTKEGVKPTDWPRGVSKSEFVPCYAWVDDEWREIKQESKTHG